MIGLLKKRFTILQGPLAINLIKYQRDEAGNLKLASIDKLVHVCSALINMNNGIVYNEKKKERMSELLKTTCILVLVNYFVSC